MDHPTVLRRHDFVVLRVSEEGLGCLVLGTVQDFLDLGIGEHVSFRGAWWADLTADAVRDWWRRTGRRSYPNATGLMIEADGGGSNGSRSRWFKFRLQQFADETGLPVTVCHYPPGASKWNPVEHKLFSQITATWAGYVLATVAILVGLIRRTTTVTGLRVTARVMPKEYPTGVKVMAAEFRAIKLTRPKTCPQWNYTIHPRTGAKNTE